MTAPASDPAVPTAGRPGLLGRCWRAVRDFWVRPIPAQPLALFRISLGLTCLLCVASSLAPHLDLYLGPDGLCPDAALDWWLARSHHFTLLRGPDGLPWHDQWLPAGAARAWKQLAEHPAAVPLLFALWLVSLACLTVGLWTRLAAFLAWLLALTFYSRLAWLLNGGDAVLRLGLFYLLFAPAGAAWSVDAWLRRRRRPEGEPVLVPPWSVRLLQIQLCLIYLFTGLVKVVGGWPDPAPDTLGTALGQHDWLNGEAVYWVLNDVALIRWPYHWLPVPLFVCRLLSWGTLAFELGFPLLILSRRLRPWLLAGGVVFHLGILVHTEVGWFSPAMVCWYALFTGPWFSAPRSPPPA